MDCPLLEKQLSCCDEFLNVSHLDHALWVCANHYKHCPIYQAHIQKTPTPEPVTAHKVQVA